MPDTVLIVDDDPFISKAFERSLRRESFETFTAHSADEALAILESREIGVVVSDERMPGMSGLELLVAIRDRYPATVRILLTGYATLESAILAINRAEVHRFLLKPCGLAELAEIIREALAKRRILQEIKERLETAGAEPRLSEALASCGPEATNVLGPPTDTTE